MGRLRHITRRMTQAHEAGAADRVPLGADFDSPGYIGPQEDPNYLGEESQAPEANRAQMFFVLYFFMTGLHAIHMIIGIVLVGVIAYLTHTRWVIRRRCHSDRDDGPVLALR